MAIPRLSRRNFFGASAGAVVAAPKLAQSLTSADANVAGQRIGLSSPGYPESPCDEENDYWLGELKNYLRRRKAVRVTELGDDRANQVERFRLEGMRSLSPATRARMAFEDEQRRSAARELSYIDEQIADLKERLGPLAAFVSETD